MSGFDRNRNSSRPTHPANSEFGQYFYSDQFYPEAIDYRFGHPPNLMHSFNMVHAPQYMAPGGMMPPYMQTTDQFQPFNDMGMYASNMSNTNYRNRGRNSRGGRGRGSRNGSRNHNRSRDNQASESNKAPSKGQNENEHSQRMEKCDSNDIDITNEIDCPEDETCSNVGDHSAPLHANQRDQLEMQLANGSYECMICYNTIRRQVAIWSCDSCYHIFHLFCIKKWSQSMKIGVAPISPMAEELSRTGHKVWRCPACQKEHTAPSFTYVCFCGKSREPEHSLQMTPHTCGEVCGKMRGEHCPHKCLLPCHPGPCPPCDVIAKRSCLCGATSSTSKCGSSAPLQCQTVCDRELNCGVHRCAAVCHKPPCSPCCESVEVACHCGKEKRCAVCGSRDALAGSFSCRGRCERPLACGEHSCRLICHSEPCPPCPRAVDAVVTCPCGRVPIGELQAVGEGRQGCTDPIPTCADGRCERGLACGHSCPAPCHDGDCPPCAQVRSVTCRCGKATKDVNCAEWDAGAAGEFLCQRRCRKKKSCGKCRCSDVCCIDFDHVCTALCGKPLSCRQHVCEKVCHLGRCGPCERVRLEEVRCECGASVLPPPLPCGTPVPDCQRACSRTHSCDHPVRHRCHADPECPPCTVLVSKPCLGGHTERHNIPCYQRSVTCGHPCGSPLPACSHRCVRPCHDGDCLAADQPCRQPCSRPRDDCGHACASPCHEGEPCPGGQCAQQVEVTCGCGLRKKRVSCHSLTTMNKWQLWGALQGSQSSNASIDVEQLSKKTRQLECDSLCSQVERNRAFAEALNIDADPMPTLGAPTYSRWLRDFARANFDFANNVEKQLDELLRIAKESKHKSRSHSFQPMNRDKRRFVHELAEFYFCETQSYDAEPHRSVAVTAKKDRCRPPTVRMSAMVQEEIRADAKLSGRSLSSAQVIRPSAPHSSTPSSSGLQVLGRVPTTTAKREIDYFSD